MKEQERLALSASLEENVRENILPYWIDRMTDPAGGFYGRRDGNDRLDSGAPKGAILNARILWTFSAAARRWPDAPEYREASDRAYRYIIDYFIDRVHGGVFWSLDADGTPRDTKKQFYAIAFTIYGLSEYYALTGSESALREAMDLFRAIETHSREFVHNGYLEAATRDWQPIQDMRLSEKDANSSKTMNTHLHIIEAYTALLRVSDDGEVREATRNLLEVFLDRIYVERTGHFGLFFDDEWNLLDDTFSYGHDIEGSWLLLETARVLGEPELTRRTLEVTGRLALGALDGRRSDGSLIYERHADGTYDEDRHWWVQAECMVGLSYLAVFHAHPECYGEIARVWQYCREYLVDFEEGEWYWSRRADGSVNRDEDKAGFWKCPYHNTRACLETARILRV